MNMKMTKEQLPVDFYGGRGSVRDSPTGREGEGRITCHFETDVVDAL